MTQQAEPRRALLWTELCPQNLYEAVSLNVVIGPLKRQLKFNVVIK